VLILSLAQLNFRNMMTSKLNFSEGIHAVVGDNAAGKSNLLEAIYLATTGQLQSNKISEAITIGEDEAFVSAQIERIDGNSKIDIGLGQSKKLIRIDGQMVRANELAKVAAAVLICPEDADLIHGSPSGRRRYLDDLMTKISLRYGMLLREYTRTLEQRNAILRHNPQDASLATWTEKFVVVGEEIMELRQRALGRIAEIAKQSYADISGADKELELTLQSGSDKIDLTALLEEKRFEERARGTTLVGPHRDDLIINLGGYSAQAYGSRGEARTASLALRVAEYQLLLEKHDEAPILLIDDFSAELDLSRREYLLQLAADTPQAIVTGTEAPPQFTKAYKVVNGEFQNL